MALGDNCCEGCRTGEGDQACASIGMAFTTVFLGLLGFALLGAVASLVASALAWLARAAVWAVVAAVVVWALRVLVLAWRRRERTTAPDASASVPVRAERPAPVHELGEPVTVVDLWVAMRERVRR